MNNENRGFDYFRTLVESDCKNLPLCLSSPDGTMVERQSCNTKVQGSNLGVGKFVICIVEERERSREVERGRERSSERSKDKEAGMRGGEGGWPSKEASKCMHQFFEHKEIYFLKNNLFCKLAQSCHQGPLQRQKRQLLASSESIFSKKKYFWQCEFHSINRAKGKIY